MQRARAYGCVGQLPALAGGQSREMSVATVFAATASDLESPLTGDLIWTMSLTMRRKSY